MCAKNGGQVTGNRFEAVRSEISHRLQSTALREEYVSSGVPSHGNSGETR